MKGLLAILLVKALILALLIQTGVIGLAPDEAQYWTWSRKLDWGYYSKPPGIAWQIGLTTAIFGHNLFAIRFGALLIGSLLSLAVYATARAAHLSQKGSFWAAIIAAFSPLGIYLSFFTTTDGGAILFFTLAAACVIKGAREGEAPPYLLAGLCIFAGALFKWTAFVFWPIALVYLILYKKLRLWPLVAAIAISLAALLPSLYWNLSHDWATFRHVGATVGGSRGGNFTDFLMAQIALLSPIFFILLVIGYFYLKGVKNRQILLTAGFPLVALLYLLFSLFKKMQPNWACYLYPPAFPFVAWVGYERFTKGRIWLPIGTALSILMVAAAFAIPWLQESGKLPLSYKFNPFRQAVGWDKLAPPLLEAGYRPQEDFLFADKYQTAGLLSFYATGQKGAYYFNISETRKTQLSYWPQMEENEVGKTGYFVVLENSDPESLEWYVTHYQKRLAPYFESIRYCGAYPLFSVAGTPVKHALIFQSLNYSGLAPPPIEKY
jgi:4-amino-4-deoxy-L-arabinose transferase-like glycosyltransferase